MPSDHPSHKRLLNPKQHLEARKLYLSALWKPKDIAGHLNIKYGTTFTSLQISQYAQDRGWTKRRKKDAERAAVLADSSSAIVRQKKQLVAQHKDFLDAAARVGAKVIQKAETFVERAANAKELSAAATAARTGAEIYRKAVGLEGNEPSLVNHGTINVSFASDPNESPFARAKIAPVVEVDAKESDEDGSSEDAGEDLQEVSEESQPRTCQALSATDDRKALVENVNTEPKNPSIQESTG